MRRLAVVLALLLAPAVAHAQEPERDGPLRIGVRSGVALPFGNAFVESGALGTAIEAMVPVRVDAGVRLSRHWTLGARGELGVLVGAGCERCSGTDGRAGFTLSYDTAPDAAIDAWFGAGAGYEWLSWSRAVNGRAVSLGASGPEMVELQAGLDFQPERHLRLGPAVAASIGRYDAITLDGDTTRDFAALVHSWIALSVRGAYDVGF